MIYKTNIITATRFDEQDVIQASKNANCYNFIQNMPNKFETI